MQKPLPALPPKGKGEAGTGEGSAEAVEGDDIGDEEEDCLICDEKDQPLVQLIESERIYIRTFLDPMVNALLVPLKQKRLLPVDMLDALFSDAEALLALHTLILADLMAPPSAEGKDNPVNTVAEVYGRYANCMCLYAPYNERVAKAIQLGEMHLRYEPAIQAVYAAYRKGAPDHTGKDLRVLLTGPTNHALSYPQRLRAFAKACNQEGILKALIEQIQRAIELRGGVDSESDKQTVRDLPSLKRLFILGSRMVNSYMAPFYKQIPIRDITQVVHRMGYPIPPVVICAPTDVRAVP